MVLKVRTHQTEFYASYITYYKSLLFNHYFNGCLVLITSVSNYDMMEWK